VPSLLLLLVLLLQVTQTDRQSDRQYYRCSTVCLIVYLSVSLIVCLHRRNNRRDRGRLVPPTFRLRTNDVLVPQFLGRSFQKARNFTASIVTLVTLDQSFHINYSTFRRHFTRYIIEPCLTHMLVVCSDIHVLRSPLISIVVTRMQDLASEFSKTFRG